MKGFPAALLAALVGVLPPVLAGEVPAIENAVPVASGDGERLVPVLFLELKMQAFRGADPADTRRAAGAFLRRAGFEILSYQDNEAGRHVDIVAAPGSGLTERLGRYLRFREVSSRLARHPDVRSVRETRSGDLSVLLARPLYDSQIEAIVADLPEGLRGQQYRNKLMKGLWVDLSTAGMDDPGAVAAALRAAYPEQIEWAEAVVKVPSFRMEVR